MHRQHNPIVSCQRDLPRGWVRAHLSREGVRRTVGPTRRWSRRGVGKGENQAQRMILLHAIARALPELRAASDRRIHTRFHLLAFVDDGQARHQAEDPRWGLGARPRRPGPERRTPSPTGPRWVPDEAPGPGTVRPAATAQRCLTVAKRTMQPMIHCSRWFPIRRRPDQRNRQAARGESASGLAFAMGPSGGAAVNRRPIWGGESEHQVGRLTVPRASTR